MGSLWLGLLYYNLRERGERKWVSSCFVFLLFFLEMFRDIEIYCFIVYVYRVIYCYNLVFLLVWFLYLFVLD